MDTSKIVGEKIKSLRESQSISIEQLAERSGLAVEQIERLKITLTCFHGVTLSFSPTILLVSIIDNVFRLLGYKLYC